MSTEESADRLVEDVLDRHSRVDAPEYGGPGALAAFGGADLIEKIRGVGRALAKARVAFLEHREDIGG